MRRIGVLDDEKGHICIEQGVEGGVMKTSYTHGVPLGDREASIQHVTSITRRWIDEGFIEKGKEHGREIWDRLPEKFTLFSPTPVSEAHRTSLVSVSLRLRGARKALLTVGRTGSMDLWAPGWRRMSRVTERMPYLMKYLGTLGIPEKSIFVVDLAYQRPVNERDEDAMVDVLTGDHRTAIALQQPGVGKVIAQLQLPIYVAGRREVDRLCSDWLIDMVDHYYPICSTNPAVNTPDTITTTVDQAIMLSRKYECRAYLYAPDGKLGAETYSLDGRVVQIDEAWEVQELDWEE